MIYFLVMCMSRVRRLRATCSTEVEGGTHGLTSLSRMSWYIQVLPCCFSECTTSFGDKLALWRVPLVNNNDFMVETCPSRSHLDQRTNGEGEESLTAMHVTYAIRLHEHKWEKVGMKSAPPIMTVSGGDYITNQLPHNKIPELSEYKGAGTRTE